jgi:hypothetical protein
MQRPKSLTGGPFTRTVSTHTAQLMALIYRTVDLRVSFRNARYLISLVSREIFLPTGKDDANSVGNAPVRRVSDPSASQHGHGRCLSEFSPLRSRQISGSIIESFSAVKIFAILSQLITQYYPSADMLTRSEVFGIFHDPGFGLPPAERLRQSPPFLSVRLSVPSELSALYSSPQYYLQYRRGGCTWRYNRMGKSVGVDVKHKSRRIRLFLC